MRYNNRFFKTKDEAKAFQKEHGGVLTAWSPRMSSNKRADFAAEMAVALDARGEVVNKEETPYCVAWNET